MTTPEQEGAPEIPKALAMWVPLIGSEATQSLARRRAWSGRLLWVSAGSVILAVLLVLAGLKGAGVVVATCVGLVGWAVCGRGTT